MVFVIKYAHVLYIQLYELKDLINSSLNVIKKLVNVLFHVQIPVEKTTRSYLDVMHSDVIELRYSIEAYLLTNTYYYCDLFHSVFVIIFSQSFATW